MMSLSKIVQFIKTDIWRIRDQDLGPAKRRAIQPLRIFLLALRGFAEDKCGLRASALTYYSLLSLVPVAAMMFGIAKGFSFEKNLERRLLTQFADKQAVVEQVISFSRSLLENAKGGVVAGIGVLLLFWTVIKVLSNIESTFNQIWGVKKSRSFARKISDYLSLILIAPLLFVTSSALTVAVAGQLRGLVEGIALLGPIAPLVNLGIQLLPYGVLWLLFTFSYIFLPNTQVRFGSAAIAGVAAGTLFQLFQMMYIHLQIGVAQYNAVYGSFAALPLFLMWLNISWLIVLFGAELSFAHQNVETYAFEPDCLNVSSSFKKLLSLRIVHRLVQVFSRGDPPLDEVQIAHELGLPIRLVRAVLFDLNNAGVVSQINLDDNRNAAYQPALDPERITIQFVLETLDRQGVDTLPLVQEEVLKKLSQSLKALDEAVERAPANKLLKEI